MHENITIELHVPELIEYQSIVLVDSKFRLKTEKRSPSRNEPKEQFYGHRTGPRPSGYTWKRVCLHISATSDFASFVQSFGAGYIVKMLLNEYLKARELYLTYSDEDALYSELKALNHRRDPKLAETFGG